MASGSPRRLEPTPGLEPQTLAGGSLPARLASFVKLPHTLFALPFAGVGAVLASHTHPAGITAPALFWIGVAFTAARFAAMGFNRIVDRHQDALNPRTRLRELPSGRLSPAQAWTAVAVASAIFILAAWQLNPLCGALSPVALAWVFSYSFTKRFTTASHAVLGLALGIAPVGAYLAVAGEWATPWFALPALALAVTAWVAGFDIVYALQDVDFDRRYGLHSVPARWGGRRALGVARMLHLLAFAGFAAMALFFDVGRIYVAGLAVVAVLLVYEHWLVHDQAGGALDLARIDRAFFRVNIAVSGSLFLFLLLDRLVPV